MQVINIPQYVIETPQCVINIPQYVIPSPQCVIFTCITDLFIVCYRAGKALKELNN